MKLIQVTVIFALPDIQYIDKINIKLGSNVKDVILASNIFSLMQGVSLYALNIGIYNKIVHLKSKVQNGDRIEIYRNLIIDPKERRRQKHSILKKH